MANNYQSQPKFARNVVLSPNSQTAWNAALAAEYMTQAQRFDGSAIMELIQSRRSDAAYAGKGTEFATNGQVTMWDSKFSGLKCEASAWLAGWAFAFLMGQDTVTGAGPYTHSFSFEETTREGTPTTIYVEDTEAIAALYPDMCVNDVTLTVNDLGAIMIETNMVGTGRSTPGTISMPQLPTDAYILCSDMIPTFGPVGDTAAFTGRVRSATLKFDAQLSVVKGMGGGLYGVFVRKQNAKFSFSLSIAAKDTDDVYTLFENDTASALTLTADSAAAAQLTINYPLVHLKGAKIGFDGDEVVWQIEGDETTCFQTPAAGESPAVPPVTVTVVNGVAAYLAQEA